MRVKTQKQFIGDVGEHIACRYLMRKGHTILDRKYRKKLGEIDIISQFRGETHFIEVKTFSKQFGLSVSRETVRFRPEEQVHPGKLRNVFHTISVYLAEHRNITDWTFDVVAIDLYQKEKLAKVRYLEDLVISN